MAERCWLQRLTGIWTEKRLESGRFVAVTHSHPQLEGVCSQSGPPQQDTAVRFGSTANSSFLKISEENVS